MSGKELQKQLTWEFPHIGKEKPQQIEEEAAAFCEGYKTFLNRGKTERECVKTAEELLKAAGYQVYDETKTYQPGDKVYQINRGKSLIAATFGKRPVKEGVRINGAHIDSPRLDLKPMPLYEKDEMALFKTHYYGGIRKYQWTAIPLAMHGVVIKADGEAVELNLGENPGDPVFCITDLLPHLAGEQNERKLKDGVQGEELNIVVGSLPFVCEEDIKEAVKLNVLQILHEQYQITEKDFLRAEVEFVPAFKASDAGLDRSMIGAYGQDDRVCAYTALMAEIDEKEPLYTTVTVLTDKEGNRFLRQHRPGFQLRRRLYHLAGPGTGSGPQRGIPQFICLSSDVNAAYDPTFHQVYEPRNSSYINKGCVLTKYTGSRGKSGSNDASAELMAKIIGIMDREGVCWQIGELGAVDAGGGGTIAKFVASLNIDVVDLGVPILSMHSPFELASKLDVYHTYKAFRAFCRG